MSEHASSHGDHSDDHSHGATYSNYIMGFILSVLLTIPAFYVVMGEPDISVGLALTVIFGLGAIQILVHVFYFLHVTIAAEEGWQALSILFTTILVVICLIGSVWVMFHLEENMMPNHDQIEALENLQ